MHTLSKLTLNDLVKGLPKLKFKYDHICDVCQLEK